MGQPAATDGSQRTRRVINPSSPVGEPEDYARVGLNDYYRDLDRCVIPIWTPEMDLLPVWQFECMMALMDAPIDVEGNRLIHAAARSANQHALAVLVDLGVRTNCPNYGGQDAARCPSLLRHRGSHHYAGPPRPDSLSRPRQHHTA